MSKATQAPTLSQAIEGRLLAANAKGLSDNTIREYSLYFRKLLAFFAPEDPLFDQIDVEHLQDFLITQEHLSNKTRSNMRIAFSSMWAWAVHAKLLTVNVAAELDTIKAESRVPHPFTRDDVKAMLGTCEKSKPYTRPGYKETIHTPPQVLRNKAIIFTLTDTGLRSSELCDLLIKHLDKKNLRMKVFGKGSKERLVPFSATTSLAIWRYLTTRPDARPDDHAFVTGRDRPMDKFELRDLIGGIGERAGVEHAHPHRFRHTFAINFLRNGGNVYALKEILGHASLRMCLRYLEIAQADVENAYRPASPVKNWGL